MVLLKTNMALASHILQSQFYNNDSFITVFTFYIYNGVHFLIAAMEFSTKLHMMSHNF